MRVFGRQSLQLRHLLLVVLVLLVILPIQRLSRGSDL